MTGIAPRDLTSRDFAFASVCTIAVFVAASFALAHARLEHHSELPVIDPGSAIPIAVRPVADIGPVGAKRGGSKRKASRKPASASQPTEPSPADDAVADPPTEAVPSAWQRKPRAPTEQPPTPLPDVAAPAPEPAEAPAEEPEPSPDAAPPESSEAPAEPNASEGGEGAGGAEGQTGTGSGAFGDGPGGGGTEPGEGEGGGSGDPLLERAIAFYRARLVAWFASRFRVTGSGLPPEKLAKYRVKAQIEIGDDRRIVAYKVLSSDHPAFEKAARATLEALRGETLPAPPENYPGAVQRQLTVSFTCTEDACD